jgi:hypothetical protein
MSGRQSEPRSKSARVEPDIEHLDGQLEGALAALAGGMVHDLNDLLMNVLGGLDLARDQLTRRERVLADDDVLATIEAIREATARGHSVVGQLIVLARGR